MKNRFSFLLLLPVVYLLSSCSASRKTPVSYLALPYDTQALSNLHFKERQIQKGDMLGIVVYSDNPVATAIFNQPIVASSGGSERQSSNPFTGYLVDDSGNIQFQNLGNIHVGGLTKQQVSDTLISRLKVFLTNPYCSIRLLNYKVTVMGEVMKPGSFNIVNERVNVLEAIGMSGDVSLYAKKDNVKVLREINGKREIGVLDLRDPNLFKSDFYYLQQNDIVIVDQVKNKQQASDQVTIRNISILATIVSTLAIVFSAIRK
jgi:polysaccharide biosynthesis/export protein